MSAVVYRALAADGRVLYIGCSTMFGSRLRGHAASTAWFKEVASIAVEHHATYGDARRAEAAAIEAENPPHNTHHRTMQRANERAIDAGVTGRRATVGKRIKDGRRRMGMTQHELAQAMDARGCGVSMQAVSAWERGAALPTAANSVMLARVLGVSWSDLFALDDEVAA